ncbi:probable serine/threonine-protein kinase PBL7 [Papaver somniferum]|uniref:probable serine/threonine-protein kinase PBL7 n=1 Tax=Papaver somniferum TaxID=3469 RepID=UPI000E6F988D|nr:probable serine/threonine-protein kinase PBL7 [Papaver somniferum]
METIGYATYAPPEYFMTGKLTLRHVIYSFGVVLLELIAGRKAIQENLPFLEQTRPLLVSKKFTEIADTVLGGRYPEHGLAQALTVAEMCMREDATKRPPIAQIVTLLSDILSEAEGEAWDKKEAS